MSGNWNETRANIFAAPFTLATGGLAYPAAKAAYGSLENAGIDYYKGEIKPPYAPPTPGAPQTQEEMIGWTPAQLEAADSANWAAWAADPFPDPSEGNQLQFWLFVALGVGALYVVAKVARHF